MKVRCIVLHTRSRKPMVTLTAVEQVWRDHAERYKQKEPDYKSGSIKELATTYSRGSYTTTTIGKTVFDGRVRDGIGSVHSFMVTNKIVKNVFSEIYTQENNFGITIRELKSQFLVIRKKRSSRTTD